MYEVLVVITFVLLMVVWFYIVGKLLLEHALSFIEERDLVIPFKQMWDVSHSWKKAKPGAYYNDGYVMLLVFYPMLAAFGALVWPGTWIVCGVAGALYYLREEKREADENNQPD